MKSKPILATAADAPRSPDPLHGVTLETLVSRLVEYYGWEEMGRRIKIRCFNFDPSVKSSLKFLRKTPWARAKVEELYLRQIRLVERQEAKLNKESAPTGEAL